MRARASSRSGSLGALCVLHAVLAVSACGPRPLTLPTGDATPLSDTAPLLAALAHCRQASTITAEIGLSGRAAGQRIRGTLHAGFAPPDSLRLEAVAPFGGPIFVLAGGGGRATLLLPRDDRVLHDADPAAILEALSGLDAAPADLAAWVGGCPAAPLAVERPRRYGDEWMAADLSNQRRVWLARERIGWQLRALTDASLTVEFAGHSGSQPSQMRIRRAGGTQEAPIDLRLSLRQVERGIALPGDAFAVAIPDGAIPITVEDLRQSGPLRDRP